MMFKFRIPTWDSDESQSVVQVVFSLTQKAGEEFTYGSEENLPYYISMHLTFYSGSSSGECVRKEN